MLSPLSGILGPLSATQAVAASAGFDPASIAGLQLWLSADSGVYSDAAGTTPATGGGAVALWRDRSGNGRDATQPDASKRPTLAAAALNGLPAVRFAGSPGMLDLAFYLLGTGPYTLFAAGSRSGTADYYPVGGSTLYTSLGIASNGNYIFAYDDGSVVQYGSGQPTGAMILTFRRDQFGVNAAARDAGADVGSTADAAQFSVAHVGGRAGSDVVSSAGDFAEILLYDADLTTAERADVLSYLNARYAVY